ncbi:MAG TPA: undecaprenyldiphospho-muramoylpentapeptide beta-N-acetylglucosaminyltransferase [Pyrinomonadaceae bacterium]|nr:undecaprenyldiphospho-muramoylpentapeptide beta-N-acetylglucosaminyltransferase [Pyrinomonadaceae bacterium]
MKVLIAAGGTGGHIFPGIAVAKEMIRRDPDAEILFVGTARGLEKKIVPENGFQLSLITSAGLKNVGLSGKIKGLAVLPISFYEAARLLREFRPDVVVGAGGYVSGPMLLTASLLGYPTLVMDSNALPGFTNRKLARFVDKAALSFEEAMPYFRDKGLVTGNPVRKEFFEIVKKPRGEKISILVFGGSQGARAINNAMLNTLPLLENRASQLRIVHQTGEADFERAREMYKRSLITDHEVRPFIHDMFAEFAKADIVICRAGATTCAELAAAGKASVMIPLPTAADDHQRKNAEAFERAGASRMIVQADLSGERLAEVVAEMINSPETVSSMEAAARSLGRADAAEATVDLIEQLARKDN